MFNFNLKGRKQKDKDLNCWSKVSLRFEILMIPILIRHKPEFCIAMHLYKINVHCGIVDSVSVVHR